MAEEFVHSPGKWIHKVYGAVMLLILAVVFLPAVLASRKLEQYCGELAIGTPASEVESQIEARGYDSITLDDGRIRIYDSRSFNRPGCYVRFDDQKLSSATFVD